MKHTMFQSPPRRGYKKEWTSHDSPYSSLQIRYVRLAIIKTLLHASPDDYHPQKQSWVLALSGPYRLVLDLQSWGTILWGPQPAHSCLYCSSADSRQSDPLHNSQRQSWNQFDSWSSWLEWKKLRQWLQCRGSPSLQGPGYPWCSPSFSWQNSYLWRTICRVPRASPQKLRRPCTRTTASQMS